jgi:hypothetical protein
MARKFQDSLAYPPRLMNADRAAAYLDLSKTKFLEGVDRRCWPQPKDADGTPRWDRRELDLAVDALDGREKKRRSGAKHFDELMPGSDEFADASRKAWAHVK